MEEKVLALVKNVLEIDSIDVNCSQDNCEKWDSMALLNIVVDLQDEFNVDFEPEEISKLKSIKDILAALKEKGIE